MHIVFDIFKNRERNNLKCLKMNLFLYQTNTRVLGTTFC